MDTPKNLRVVTDSFAFPPGMEPGRYLWRVTAETDEGVAGDPSVIRVFQVEEAHEPEGRLVVNVSPGGDIYLGDRLLKRDATSLDVTVDTGAYVLRAENPRAETKIQTRRIRIAEGETCEHTFTFTIPPPKPKIDSIEVRVGSDPRGGDIYVNGRQYFFTQDGRRVPARTPNTLWLPRGSYTITVKITKGDGTVEERSKNLVVAGDTIHKVPFDFDE
jgi:hypothetical protein